MMQNMCCAKAGAVEALDAASVGAFAFVGKDGRPRACPVTPYLYAGEAVVSSTLAFTAKVAAVRRDPRVALLAGGCLVRGRATLDVDLTSKTFDERVRRQELRKYPPSRLLLAIPGHRRLLWWYVGRASIAIPIGDWARAASSPGSFRLIPLRTPLATRFPFRSATKALPACSSTTRSPTWRTYASSPCTA